MLYKNGNNSNLIVDRDGFKFRNTWHCRSHISLTSYRHNIGWRSIDHVIVIMMMMIGRLILGPLNVCWWRHIFTIQDRMWCVSYRLCWWGWRHRCTCKKSADCSLLKMDIGLDPAFNCRSSAIFSAIISSLLLSQVGIIRIDMITICKCIVLYMYGTLRKSTDELK